MRDRLAPVALIVLGCGLPLPAAAATEPSSATELNNRGVQAAQAGRFEEAVELLRRAREADPADRLAQDNLSGVLTDWALLLDQQGLSDEAIARLQEAVRFSGENGTALVRLGDLLYRRRSDMAGAIRAWEQAHGHVPSDVWPGVANRIAGARRDQLLEHGFTTHATAHFDLRVPASYTGNTTPLEQILEDAYARLSKALGRGPARLSVLLYTGGELQRVYNKRDWALGLYDGRLRLQVDELTISYLPDMIAHELAHAFLHQLYGERIPTWIHEGYAQLQEASRPADPELQRIAAGVASRTLWIPLSWLDRHFEQPSGGEDIQRAYVQARVAVEQLINRYGMERFTRFLGALAQGTAVDAAYDNAFAPSRWARASAGNFE